jgi:hypothetical protein
VFAAVAEEFGQRLGIEDARMVRYDDDRAATVVASWRKLAGAVLVGMRITLEGESRERADLSTRAGRAHGELRERQGRLAATMRGLGVRSAIGAPIVVDGRLWGAMSTASLRPEPIPWIPRPACGSSPNSSRPRSRTPRRARSGGLRRRELSRQRAGSVAAPASSRPAP